MMVSGVNSSSTTMFSNYRLSNVSTNQNTQQETESAKGPGGPGGAGGRKGPPPGGGKGRGPEVDTNNDDVWDADELTSLSEELSESGATSFSVDQLLETYDTDGDGVISATEREAIKENNAFNLPDMKNMQQVMMNGSRGLQIQQSSIEELETVELEDQTIAKMISAYVQQNQYASAYINPDLDVTTD